MLLQRRMIVPENKERLAVKVFHIIEGEAEGPFAIAVLFAVIIIVAIVWRFF
jgi:hypothetical protein